MTISKNDRQAELSYAYLHAVASAAGFSCSIGSRLEDGRGIDARVGTGKKLAANSRLEDFDIDVQLKSISQKVTENENKISFYFRGLDQYNKLRSEKNGSVKIVVLLILPVDSNEWITVSPSELILKNAAYWATLRGAPASSNSSGETIYFPKENLLTVDALKNLMTLISTGEVITYGA
jgi:hypothetical protein